jgi:hypothetical protein
MVGGTYFLDGSLPLGIGFDGFLDPVVALELCAVKIDMVVT